jgi:hypothetical protein
MTPETIYALIGDEVYLRSVNGSESAGVATNSCEPGE